MILRVATSHSHNSADDNAWGKEDGEMRVVADCVRMLVCLFTANAMSIANKQVICVARSPCRHAFSISSACVFQFADFTIEWSPAPPPVLRGSSVFFGTAWAQSPKEIPEIRHIGCFRDADMGSCMFYASMCTHLVKTMVGDTVCLVACSSSSSHALWFVQGYCVVEWTPCRKSISHS